MSCFDSDAPSPSPLVGICHRQRSQGNYGQAAAERAAHRSLISTAPSTALRPCRARPVQPDRHCLSSCEKARRPRAGACYMRSGTVWPIQLREPVQGAMGEAAAAAVQAVWTQEGPEAGRQLYQRMLVLPPPGLAFFNRMIDLESAVEASCPSKAGSDRICRIFEVSQQIRAMSQITWLQIGTASDEA